MQKGSKGRKQSMLDGVVKKIEVLKEFSKDHLTDYLMKLIICDDQVSSNQSIESGKLLTNGRPLRWQTNWPSGTCW